LSHATSSSRPIERDVDAVVVVAVGVVARAALARRRVAGVDNLVEE
jgi:hypothetical protein